MRVDWLHRCGHTAACKSFDLGLVSYRPLAGVLRLGARAKSAARGRRPPCKQATVLEALATVEEAEVVVVHVQSRVGMRTTKASLAMRPLAALAGASALAYVLPSESPYADSPLRLPKFSQALDVLSNN